MLARAGAVGVVLVVLLGLVACGGSEDGAQTLPSVANVPSETPLPSPSPTEQRTPRPSKKPTSQPSASPSVSVKPGVDISAEEAASAVAFVERFWATVSHSASGGDLRTLRSLYTDACSTCKSIYDQVSAIRSKGQHVVGAETRVLTSRIDKSVPGSTAVVLTSVQNGAGKLVDADGTVVDRYTGSPVADYVFNLEARGESWLIFDLVALGPR